MIPHLYEQTLASVVLVLNQYCFIGHTNCRLAVNESKVSDTTEFMQRFYSQCPQANQIRLLKPEHQQQVRYQKENLKTSPAFHQQNINMHCV